LILVCIKLFLCDNDSSMSHIRSIDLVEKYLLDAGYKVEHFPSGINPAPIAKITSKSGKSICLYRVDLAYPFAISSLAGIFANKQISYGFMADNGIPIPYTKVISNSDFLNNVIGQEVLDKFGTVAVKPINGRRSYGLTMDITTEAQLKQAVEKALVTNNKEALVQEQFFGEEARFIVLDGKVRAVLLREKPYVTGDGKSTIEELIKAENIVRSNITDSMVKYPAFGEDNVLADILYSKRVPTEGERVELNNATMIRRGASVYDIFSTTHRSYIEIIEKTVKDFGKGMFVADFMSKDFNLPAQSGNFIFLEFNLNAALPLFYSCRDGKHFKILEEFLGPMLKSAIETESC
jgi:cyanophycin synthetase